jgi:hypothetical protein
LQGRDPDARAKNPDQAVAPGPRRQWLDHVRFSVLLLHFSGLPDVFSPQFAAIRDAAHRKPSTFCTHRAIVRHMSFWIEDAGFDHAKQPPLLFDVASMRDLIDARFKKESEILDNFYDQLCGIPKLLIPNITERDSNLSFTNCKIYSGHDNYGFYNRFIITRHFGRVSVKHVVDSIYNTSRHPGSHKDYESKKRRSPLGRAFAEVASGIERYVRLMDEANTDNVTSPREYLKEHFWNHEPHLKTYVDYLYNTYWSELDKRLSDDKTIENLKDFSFAHDILKFAEFHGVIFPACSNLPSHREGDIKKIALEEDYALLYKNWPIIKVSEVKGDDQAGYFSFNDIVACGVGKSSEGHPGVGIYVSSLGQQNYRSSPPRDDAPIRYLILAKTQNYRQLGRLIDSIDKLGVYRLIALRDFEKLRLAGEDIQKIGEIVDRADEAMADKTTFPAFVKDTGAQIEKVGDDIQGGLAYRLFANTHYSRSLRSLVDTMHFDKIVGFETYDEFLKRKLYQIYDYNELLIERLGRLRIRHANLVAQVQLQSLDRRAADQKEELGELRKTAVQTKRLMETGHLIEIFAITYYVGNMVSSAAEAMHVPGNEAVSYAVVFVFWLVARDWVRSGLAWVASHVSGGRKKGGAG